MNKANPYEPPNYHSGPSHADNRRHRLLVRVLLAIHLLGITGTFAVVRRDLSGSASTSDLMWMLEHETVQIIPLLTVWTPILIAIVVCGHATESKTRQAAIVGFDVLLSFLQLWMMLPLVQ